MWALGGSDAPPEMNRFAAHVIFPCPAPSYTIDSFPGELIWVPRRTGYSRGSPCANAGPEPFLAGVGGGGGAGTGEPDAAWSSFGGSSPSDDEAAPCLLLPYESARYLIIFFHSNAEDLGRCRWFLHFLRDQFQVHVLAVEYPGYGVCRGPPSRAGVLANASAALAFAMDALRLPLESIKIFGRSIGTGPAVYIAARHRVAGLILVTPFWSIRKLFQDRVGPLHYLVEEWFDNGNEIMQVRCPTMIIHGKRDIIIPCCHGEMVFKACTARKMFVNPHAMEHNTNLTTDTAFLIVPMFRFFALPDYSFQDLKVPIWAYDKRRSHEYVRPDMEVYSAAVAPFSSPARRVGLDSPDLPQGDSCDGCYIPPPSPPVCQIGPSSGDLASALQPVGGTQVPRAGAAVLAGGGSPAPGVDKVRVLTQPTVRHTYASIKRDYNFATPANAVEDDARAGAEMDCDQQLSPPARDGRGAATVPRSTTVPWQCAARLGPPPKCLASVLDVAASADCAAGGLWQPLSRCGICADTAQRGRLVGLDSPRPMPLDSARRSRTASPPPSARRAADDAPAILGRVLAPSGATRGPSRLHERRLVRERGDAGHRGPPTSSSGIADRGPEPDDAEQPYTSAMPLVPGPRGDCDVDVGDAPHVFGAL